MRMQFAHERKCSNCPPSPPNLACRPACDVVSMRSVLVVVAVAASAPPHANPAAAEKIYRDGKALMACPRSGSRCSDERRVARRRDRRPASATHAAHRSEVPHEAPRGFFRGCEPGRLASSCTLLLALGELRARVEHALARLKDWRVLRDHRRRGRISTTPSKRSPIRAAEFTPRRWSESGSGTSPRRTPPKVRGSASIPWIRSPGSTTDGFKSEAPSVSAPRSRCSSPPHHVGEAVLRVRDEVAPPDDSLINSIEPHSRLAPRGQRSTRSPVLFVVVSTSSWPYAFQPTRRQRLPQARWDQLASVQALR